MDNNNLNNNNVDLNKDSSSDSVNLNKEPDYTNLTYNDSPYTNQYGYNGTSTDNASTNNFNNGNAFNNMNSFDNNSYNNNQNSFDTNTYNNNQNNFNNNFNNDPFSQPFVEQPVPIPVPVSSMEDESQIVPVGEWVWSLLLMFVPCVNLVMMFIFAFSGTKKSKQNFFKAYLIVTGIGVVLYFILVFVFASIGMTSALMDY